MAKYAATERSRSVTPVADVVRGPNRQSAARRALLLERLRATRVRDLDSPPPRLHALPVQATPGGSLNVRGDSVPLEQTPGGRLRVGEARQVRKPSPDLSLCSDVVERVEALDMSEDEAVELMQYDPWHLSEINGLLLLLLFEQVDAGSAGSQRAAEGQRHTGGQRYAGGQQHGFSCSSRA